MSFWKQVFSNFFALVAVTIYLGLFVGCCLLIVWKWYVGVPALLFFIAISMTYDEKLTR